MTEQQEYLLDHYHNPRNFGLPKFEFTHYAKALNASCGDEIEVWINVGDDNKIADIAFNGEGCSIAIASASLLTEDIKHKDLLVIQSLDNNYIRDLLQITLTPSRIRCSTLIIEALKNL